MKIRFGTRAAASMAAAIVWMSMVQQAGAQTPDPAAPPVLVFRDTVVVTAERGEAPQSWIPAATVSFDSAALAGVPAVSLGEFISFVPGFRVQQSGFHAGRPVVSARGFFGGGEAEYVALLVDGVRVADAESGLVEWSTIAGVGNDPHRGRARSRRVALRRRRHRRRHPGAHRFAVDRRSRHLQRRLARDLLGRRHLAMEDERRWRIRSPERPGGPSGISDHSDASELTFGSAINGTMQCALVALDAGFLGREPGGSRRPDARRSARAA